MHLGLYFTGDSCESTGIGKGSDVGDVIGVGTRVLGPLAGAVAVPEAPYPPAPAGIMQMQVQVQITMQRNNFDVTTQRNPHSNKCNSNIRDRNKLKHRLSHNHNQYYPHRLQFVCFHTW
jgi:hypothetical protein